LRVIDVLHDRVGRRRGHLVDLRRHAGVELRLRFVHRFGEVRGAQLVRLPHLLAWGGLLAVDRGWSLAGPGHVVLRVRGEGERHRCGGGDDEGGLGAEAAARDVGHQAIVKRAVNWWLTDRCRGSTFGRASPLTTPQNPRF
jgi:hypothetical protein